MDEILKLFPDITGEQRNQFAQLKDLYTDWNSKINVISRKDIDHLYLHHVVHSLAIEKFIQFKSGTSIIDVGTGGGFPGIPMAIMRPECNFTLVDSIAKKLKVAQDVADTIGLSNIKTIHSRAEDLKQKFDFVISRAVTNLPNFLKFTRKLISKDEKNALPNGIVYLKGGDLQEEIQFLNAHVDIFPITDYIQHPYFDEKYVVYICL